MIKFEVVKEFLESWGLSFKEGSNIQYPEVYDRMIDDAAVLGKNASAELADAVNASLFVVNGKARIDASSWDELKEMLVDAENVE